MTKQKIIVFDGYDGSGKTTLAKLLAQRIGGQYVKVFTGTLGNLIGWLYDTRQFTLADTVSRTGIRYMLDLHKDAPYLIFDRHWITMFALLPKSYHHNWGTLPPTFLCWADIVTTRQRLLARGETFRSTDDPEDVIARYRDLALKFGVSIIDTVHHTPQSALDVVLAELEG